ncbi:MAG: glutathione S-transferase family protein [Paracoccaceae bacterium]
MYTVIGAARSRAIRVYWALEEMGLEYQANTAPPRSNEAMKHNPSGKVPCLLVEGETLLDSVAIIQYLADKHDKLTFAAGTIARAQQDSFTQFCCDEIDSILWTATKHTFVLPEKYRVPAIIETAQYEFARAMKTLEARLGDKEFIMGDQLSIPDIILGHCGTWADVAHFEVPKGPLTAYFSRLAARPAFVKSRQLSNARPSLVPKET